MDGTSPGGPGIGWDLLPRANAANGMQWWNGRTGQWQAEMPMPSVACAPPPNFQWVTTATLKWQPDPPSLSDADVDRIARRVVELLREAKP